MLRVGLTGGIGAGKSTVAGRLAEHGAVLIDADKLAREVVEPGQPALEDITVAFGRSVLHADGRLNREALAEAAFADDESRARLNAIMHPRIGQRTAELMSGAADDAIVVHDVPLLVENGLAPAYHLVIVVDAPLDVRVKRLVGERGMTESDARARIAAQATEEQRRAAADVWLDNGGALDEVQAAVDALWADRLVHFEANLRLHRAVDPEPTPAPAPVDMRRLAERVRIAAGARAESVAVADVPGVIDLRPSTSDNGLADSLTGAGFPPLTDGLHGNADPGLPLKIVLAAE